MKNFYDPTKLDCRTEERVRRIVDLSRRRDRILEASMLDLEALAVLAADYEGQYAMRGGGAAEKAGILPKKGNGCSLVINKKHRRKEGINGMTQPRTDWRDRPVAELRLLGICHRADVTRLSVGVGRLPNRL
jgi:hypothetical protein